MVDHLAWAQGYRDRAAKCLLSAKNASSVEFGECYRLLEKYYLMLANLEEEFGRKQVASLMPPVSLKEVDRKPAFPMQAEKPTALPKEPNKETAKEPASLKENEMRSENQSPAPSLTARMLAVRQLQGSSPFTGPSQISVAPSMA